MNIISRTVPSRRRRISAAQTETLIKRVLELLLDYAALDPYWFHLNQRDLRAEHLLRAPRLGCALIDDVLAELVALGVSR